MKQDNYTFPESGNKCCQKSSNNLDVDILPFSHGQR